MTPGDTVKIVHDISLAVIAICAPIGAWMAHRSNENTKRNGKVAKDTNATVKTLQQLVKTELTAYIKQQREGVLQTERKPSIQEERELQERRLIELENKTNGLDKTT